METKTSLTVIEFHTEEGAEWALSFGGNNPEEKDYFSVKNSETAFRLKDRLADLFPPK